MDLTGKIKVVFDEQQFDSGFRKREFVVSTQEQYPQDIKFELINDKIDSVPSMSVGEEVTVHFDIRGNEYKGRYYVNLRAWRVEQGSQAPAAGGAPATGAAAPPPSAPPPSAAPEQTFSEEDDLPF